MYIALVETCSDYALANILLIVQRAMNLLQIIVPIIALVALIKIFTQLTVNPDNKKLKNALKNWLIALLVFFFLPVIINTTMGLLHYAGYDFNIVECWNAAKDSSTDLTTGKEGTDDYNNSRKPLF